MGREELRVREETLRKLQAIAAPEDYTKIGTRLYELLDAEYRSGRITEENHRRIRGGD